jgi:hypothetical protein
VAQIVERRANPRRRPPVVPGRATGPRRLEREKHLHRPVPMPPFLRRRRGRTVEGRSRAVEHHHRPRGKISGQPLGRPGHAAGLEADPAQPLRVGAGPVGVEQPADLGDLRGEFTGGRRLGVRLGVEEQRRGDVPGLPCR